MSSIYYKKAFGIMEVLVAALVLGILYTAVLNLQGGNREALIRIRGRDGATEVAQYLIDSLNNVGIAAFTDDVIGKKEDDNSLNPIIIKNIKRTWKGQPGTIQHDISVNYDAEINLSNDTVFKAEAFSAYDTVQHIFAKKINVKVSWKFKNSTQSINLSGIIR